MRLLIVWHSRTGLARQMAQALQQGAYAAANEMGVSRAQFEVEMRRAADATVSDVLTSDGYLFCAPENLASASGEMLEFFHRSYYAMFTTQNSPENESSRLLGRPYGLAIAAGSDGSGAARQLERICRGWRLRPVSDTLIHRNGLPQTIDEILKPKECSEDGMLRCMELGGLVAATLILRS